MKRIFVLALAALAIAFTTGPVCAGVDIGFGADVPTGNDGNLFASISSRYFDRDVRVVEDWGDRYRDPNDLSVALFMDRHCGKGPEYYADLRKQGLGWSEISNRCGISPDVYFLPVKRDPGPPYGKAYGHWKKHKKDPKVAFVLRDTDIRNLVAARMVHEYYGVPPETAMKWCSSGRDVSKVMVREYRKRHGKGGDKDHGHGAQGHDKNGHGHKDHDKGGQDKDKGK